MILKLCWLMLGLIHFFPAVALFWPSLLIQLYSVEAGDTVCWASLRSWSARD